MNWGAYCCGELNIPWSHHKRFHFARDLKMKEREGGGGVIKRERKWEVEEKAGGQGRGTGSGNLQFNLSGSAVAK